MAAVSVQALNLEWTAEEERVDGMEEVEEGKLHNFHKSLCPVLSYVATAVCCSVPFKVQCNSET
jgi:hypothetical protein